MTFTKQLRCYSRLILATIIIANLFSCSQIDFDMPPGPEGPAGLSAYELWKESVENGNITDWPKDKTDITDYFVYIKGEKGDKGEDGKSAYQLWKDIISTGEVPNPHNPNEMWNKDRNTETDFWDYLTGRDGISPHVGDNGNWWIGTTDTGVPTKGKDGIDGVTPHIGTNGNWWIGITDTQVPAKGQNGETPHIGDNGNWWIGTTDTSKPAKGIDGSEGKSAYESWKELAERGNLDDPKNPGEKWDKNKVEAEHFIQYLTGANGKDGVAGKDGTAGQDGKDGVDGQTPYIGTNGNWWIGTTDTRVPAKGEDGKDGIDGHTPHIGENSNWWIGTTDTGKPAKGENGKDGIDGTSPHIGTNGNWWIGTTDTGKPARGESGSDGINGTNGSDGKSAYELWTEDVKAGKIKDQDGNPWATTDITQADFWKYLAGKDGKDGVDGTNGTNGKDGVNGLSAYDIWKDLIKDGTVDDPKNPAVKWPADKNSEKDFWSFLMGKDGANGLNGLNGNDGQSAYELWVEEVKKGLANPHEPGTEWAKDKISTDNFWEYLSGKDGKDGIAGKPGEPGQPIEIVTGVPNVIAQYALQEYSEYVRWSDGGVLYKVYDNVGQPASGAIVKGLPGLDPSKTYTANSKGEFIIPKEDLPEGEPISDLVGKTLDVTYVKSTGATVTEASAANTYVPNRIHIRIKRNHQNFSLNTLYNGTIALYTQCERHNGSPDSDWEIIPNYLGSLSQKINVYELSDSNDPTSFDETSVPYYSKTQDISASTIYLYLSRHHVRPDWLLTTANPEWDGKDHYYIVRMDSYYGERPVLPAVLKSAPIQYVPSIKDIKNVKNYSDGLNAVANLTVEFNVSELNPDLIFKSYSIDKTISISGTDYEYWVPIKHASGTTQKSFHVTFKYTASGGGGIISNNASNLGSINSPESLLLNTHVNASVYLSIDSSSTTDYYFTSIGTSTSNYIGKLEFDKANMKLNFIGTKNAKMQIPDILGISIQ